MQSLTSSTACSPLRLRFRRVALLALIGLALVSVRATAQDATAVERYLEHVRFLASPEMRGRGAGMPELGRAAAYIANQFRQIGLKPAGEDGSFLQPFEVTTDATMGERNSLRVSRNRGSVDLKVGEEFIPINFSASGEVEGQVVFAGYGATAEEFHYDDYFHFDVTDKIVLLLRYEPDFFRDGRRRRRRARRAPKGPSVYAALALDRQGDPGAQPGS